MNEANTSSYQQFVWRRLSDPLELFGRDLPSELWLVVLALVLITAFFYVGWMYLKDSRGVGLGWAALLAVLRSSVYVLLATVFLLPAMQTWEETRVQSKVLLAIDVSPSLTNVIDDIPTGKAGEKLKTRQDYVLAFLTDPDKKFLANLEVKNPVTAFRFATRLDENYLLFKDGRNWTRAEWEEFTREADRNPEPPEAKPLPFEYLQSWLNPARKVDAPEEWSERDKKRLKTQQELSKKLAQASFFSGTNVGSAVQALVNRELNGRVQGIVVFSDGRSTEGSPKVLEELSARAKSAHIPIFVVGIGEERPQVRIDIVDLRVPEQVQPEDKFRAVAELQGEGLPDKPVKPTLEITHVRKKGGKEELLDVSIIEAENKNDPKAKRVLLPLGKKVTLEAPGPVKFDRSSPPRVTVEFPIDAASLAAGAHIDLSGPDYKDKKWVLSETPDSELHFRVRVPREPLEVFTDPFHVSEPSPLRVIKKPLRVLLFASAPTRDYQFLLTILIREMQKKSAEVSVYLQLPPSVMDRRNNVVQIDPPERLLGSFPTKLEGGDKEDPLYALDSYDVIVAFDPDWSQLTDTQLKNVEKWVENGGGLVAEGGQINTVQLAKPGSSKDKLKPILDLYPVVPRDIRLDDLDRTPTEPWPLDFSGATPDMEFLKMAEGEDAGPFLSDWDAFFYGRRKEGEEKGAVVRGFYSYYPVEKAKPTAIVVARFPDPHGKLKDGSKQPYLVLTGGNRRVIWLGSGEVWRLRTYSTAFHDRFWIKLLRYAGANNLTRMNKRIKLYMGQNFTANKFAEFEAKIDAKGGEPLSADAKPKVKLTLPETVDPKEVPTEFEMKAKPGSEGWFVGRFQPRSPGNYSLQLKVQETGDETTPQRFSVKEANPEMDNTRPDFEALYQLASEADEVLARMGETERQELKKRLQRPKLSSEGAKPEAKDEKLRLYFDLKNAELIPTCMRQDVQTLRSRGPIQDFWDSGVPMWTVLLGACVVFGAVANVLFLITLVMLILGKPVRGVLLGLAVSVVLSLIAGGSGVLTYSFNPYFPMSVVLGLIVALLSIEWLTRKLLRLA